MSALQLLRQETEDFFLRVFGIGGIDTAFQAYDKPAVLLVTIHNMRFSFPAAPPGHAVATPQNGPGTRTKQCNPMD